MVAAGPPRRAAVRALLARQLTADPTTTAQPRRWGLGDAALAFVVGVVLTNVVAALVLEATGRTGQDIDELPLTFIALFQVPQWVGTLGITWLAVHRKGDGLVRDLDLRVAPRDVPTGLALGTATQLVLVPLLYIPLLRLLDRSGDDVAAEARELTDKASGLGVVLLFLVVVLAAPVVEEIFFRGLLLRSLEARIGGGPALVLSSVLFGFAHFQWLQLPALVLFGLVAGALAQRFGRLGPAIFAHIAFNAVTVIVLL
jgi:membrane protease YdiL (CAAX protease family)